MSRPRWEPSEHLERIPTPVAGTNFTFRNPSGALWVLRTIAFTFITDANAANRAMRMRVETGESINFFTQANNLQPVSDTRFYAGFAGSASAAGAESTFFLPWPVDGVWMRPGAQLVSNVQNIQVGDLFSGIVLDIIEYPDTLPTHLLPGPAPYAVSG